MIISPQAFGLFDLSTNAYKCICPLCKTHVKPRECGFTGCEYRFFGLKLNDDGPPATLQVSRLQNDTPSLLKQISSIIPSHTLFKISINGVLLNLSDKDSLDVLGIIGNTFKKLSVIVIIERKSADGRPIPEFHDLILAGKRLEGDNTVQDYGIQKESTITLPPTRTRGRYLCGHVETSYPIRV
ncbi:hypothetical protein HK098_002584 [Nowakowskiella sp. JEL0407]|nr:hypothetical protein HK098_002584 [Nowakowskiella sp. JEL0407]